MAYIQIYETVIDPKSIVGVGPFMQILPGDGVDLAFGKVTFYFDIYTTGGAVRISSNPKYFNRHADEKKDGRKVHDYLHEIWKIVRENLLTGWEIDIGLKSLKAKYEKAD